jgi:hypothetical protein
MRQQELEIALQMELATLLHAMRKEQWTQEQYETKRNALFRSTKFKAIYDKNKQLQSLLQGIEGGFMICLRGADEIKTATVDDHFAEVWTSTNNRFA